MQTYGIERLFLSTFPLSHGFSSCQVITPFRYIYLQAPGSSLIAARGDFHPALPDLACSQPVTKIDPPIILVHFSWV